MAVPAPDLRHRRRLLEDIAEYLRGEFPDLDIAASSTEVRNLITIS
jgi:hypothetical protein